jgi:magnesium transporter
MLAVAIGGELDGEVLAEMNDWVRDELLEALEPAEVAQLAGQLDTDDAVAIIEDMEAEDQQAVLRELDPDDRAAIEEALSYPRNPPAASCGATSWPCPSIGMSGS